MLCAIVLIGTYVAGIIIPVSAAAEANAKSRGFAPE